MLIVVDNIEITVSRKKVRTMRIVVSAKNASVRMSVPLKTSEAEAVRFATAKKDWIVRAVEKGKARLGASVAIRYESGDKINIFGEECTLRVYETDKKTGIAKRGSDIFLLVKPAATYEKRQSMLQKWCKIILAEELKRRLSKWEQITQLKANSFRIRNTSSRWGSCNIQTHNISFSLNLVYKPLECLDYIVVHELGHIIVHNHGAKFHEYMATYLPNYKELRKLLAS